MSTNVSTKQVAPGLTLICGGPGSGKTRTALIEIAKHQGSSAIFTEENFRVLFDKAKRWGLDLGMTTVYPPYGRDFQGILNLAVQLITERGFTLVVIDDVPISAVDAGELELAAASHPCARFIFTLTLRSSVAPTGCNCGGPDGHTPGGIHCRL